MDNFSVYRHTSPSGKCYIGITKRNPEKRWGAGGSQYLKITTSGTPKHPAFYNSIIKYGWNNIKHEILFSGLSKDRACSLEQSLIRHYKNLGLSYNTTDGGEGVWGYKFTEEQLHRLSEIHKGIKQSQETVAKRAAKNRGKVKPQTFYDAVQKPVEQYDIHGNFICSYNSEREASIALGGIQHIEGCCKGYRKTAGGFIWRYKNQDFTVESFPYIAQYDKKGNLIATYSTVEEASRNSEICASTIHRILNGKTKQPRTYLWKYITTKL